jgi:hypothetical protein
VTVALDSGKCSPEITLSGTPVLIAALQSSPYGTVAADTALPAAKTWWEVTLTSYGGGHLFVGFCTASHSFGNSGNSWAGGDLYVMGVYLYDFEAWVQGAGNYPDAGLGPSVATGDTVMIEYDPTVTTVDSQGNSSPQGVMRVRIGAFTGHTLAVPPSGTLYACLGADSGANTVTVNFGGTTPVNTPTSGYSAYQPSGGGGTSYTFAGASAGHCTTAGALNAKRPLGGTSVGLCTANLSDSAKRPFAGTSAGHCTDTGALVRRTALTGSAAGACTTTGAVVRRAPMAGSAAGVCTTQSMADNRSAPLAGTSAGQAATAMADNARRPFSGTCAATSSTSGDIVGGSASAEADNWILMRRRRR